MTEPKPVKKAKKAVKKRTPTAGVSVGAAATARTGTEIMRGTDLGQLGGLINSLPGVVTAVTEGLIDGDAGWLVSWEDVGG